MRLNEVMNVIDNNYDVFQDAKYSIHPKYPNFICKYMTVGKILSFAMDQNLEKSETLQLFCEGYRDVIATPIIEWDTIIDENLYQVEDANIGIQLFNKHGFDKLRFYKNPLCRKQEYNESVIGKLLSWAKSKEIQTPLMYPLLVGYGNMGKK